MYISRGLGLSLHRGAQNTIRMPQLLGFSIDDSSASLAADISPARRAASLAHLHILAARSLRRVCVASRFTCIIHHGATWRGNYYNMRFDSTIGARRGKKLINCLHESSCGELARFPPRQWITFLRLIVDQIGETQRAVLRIYFLLELYWSYVRSHICVTYVHIVELGDWSNIVFCSGFRKLNLTFDELIYLILLFSGEERDVWTWPW